MKQELCSPWHKIGQLPIHFIIKNYWSPGGWDISSDPPCLLPPMQRWASLVTWPRYKASGGQLELTTRTQIHWNSLEYTRVGKIIKITLLCWDGHWTSFPWTSTFGGHESAPLDFLISLLLSILLQGNIQYHGSTLGLFSVSYSSSLERKLFIQLQNVVYLVRLPFPYK